MANLRLKKLILEVVNNQLEDNNPPETKDVYDKLLAAGYSVSEAKEKIGAVVIEEIYDVMKEKQPYDEKRYTDALNRMVQQCIDYGDTYHIRTEWDEWDDLVQKGYEAEVTGGENEMIACWWEAWDIFQKIVEQEEMKTSVSDIMESQDYKYPVDEWLQDMEMELGKAVESEKRLEFCRKVLEIFDWSFDDSSNYMSAIGEELYETGKVDEGREWFENWLEKEPHNRNALDTYSWCIQKEEGIEAAYQLLKKEVIGVACTMKNDLLFIRAKSLAEYLNLTEDVKWIETQLETFRNSFMKADLYNDMYDDFRMPAQQPIVKEKKIYPNDPCPCGSGKKYKKCCGRK